MDMDAAHNVLMRRLKHTIDPAMETAELMTGGGVFPRTGATFQDFRQVLAGVLF